MTEEKKEENAQQVEIHLNEEGDIRMTVINSKK